MTMGAQGTASLLSLLRIIFSQATLRICLAGLTEAERGRNIAFYDEVASVAIRMSLPASNRTLPAPSHDARPTFHLPLRSEGLYEEDEDDEQAVRPPPLLPLLLSSLRVALEAAYVPPRLSKGPPSAAALGESDTSAASHVIASVDDEDSAYQAVHLQGGGDANATEATRMFHKAWTGNSTPPKPSLKKPVSRKGKEALEAHGRSPEDGGGADAWFVRERGEESWMVEWRCQVPIVFLRSRHPTPALVLSANLTLHLQPSRLSALAPSIAQPVTTSASEALFLHDLLNPLSEGPSYPDESPAERAARADASLAKLPLGRLPSSVLGSRLVTPARSAKDVGRLIDARQRLLVENGDMGDVHAEEYNSLAAGKRDLTNEGLMGTARDGSAERVGEDEGEKGLGEDVVVAQRSARRALDVRSAVLVRMRTTNIAGVGEAFGQPTSEEDAEDSTVPTLVLCVEVENPTNSGVKFALDDVGVQVSVPSEAYGALHPSTRIHVEAKPIGSLPTSMIIKQGEQYNLLYRVDFSLPSLGVPLEGDGAHPTTLMSETQRTITIELYGRPVMLRPRRGQEAAKEYSPGDSFTSTWSCTLDFATQIQALILRRVIAEGAGGYALGRSRVEQTGREQPDEAPSLPSIVAQRRLESRQQQQKQQQSSSDTPPSRLSLMPGGRRMALGALQTDSPQLSGVVARRGATTQSLHRPSPRSGPTDSFIALQRSPDLREGKSSMESFARRESSTTPAMPSSLVGPSILARARLNRQTALEDGAAPGTQHAAKGGRRATLVSSPHAGSSGDSTMIPTRFSTTSSRHVRNALSGSLTLNADAVPVLPLGSKSTWTRMAYLVHNAGLEQGLLIDIVGLVTAAHDDSDTASSEEQYCSIDVQLQLDNRSEHTQTVLLQWQKPSSHMLASPNGTSWLAEDESVQVGPMGPGQAEVVTLRITQSPPHDRGTTVVPPLLLIDVDTGHQRTLTCVQPLVV